MTRLALVIGAIAVAFAFYFGEGYIPRLPNHAGYYQVSVDDEVHAPAPPPPRHLVMIVIDGLRMQAALPMKSVATVREHGQCRRMDVGKLTISRPVYAILSTGLEADRTGARNNAEESPLWAQSIWEVAKTHGRDVTGSSHNEFWRQLFPNGFSEYAYVKDIDTDMFASGPIGDLALFHPDYVDEAGHQFGGASQAYADASARADREMGELLARLDFTRDVVIITADHGHVDRGGHGAEQPEVEVVLTCIGGAGIKRSTEMDPLDARSMAPLLALRLGVPFPKNMRAGQDDLDSIFEVDDLTGYAAYERDRKAAIAHFRAENAHALDGWLGGPPGTWSRLYARELGKRVTIMWLGLLLVPAVLVVWNVRRDGSKQGLRDAGILVAWMLAYYTLAIALHVLTRGTFDFTAVAARGAYVPSCLAIGVFAGLVACAAHARIYRDRQRLLRDEVTLVVVTLWLNFLHRIAWGYPLGYPIPGRHLLVFPFFGAFLLVTSGGIAIVLGLLSARVQRRMSSP